MLSSPAWGGGAREASGGGTEGKCRQYCSHLTQPRADGEIDGLGKVGGGDLSAIGRLHPGELDAAIGAHDRDAARIDLHHLAELAADAFWVLRRQGLRLEHLQRLAVERRPRARSRIAAPDQIVDLPPRLA